MRFDDLKLHQPHLPLMGHHIDPCGQGGPGQSVDEGLRRSDLSWAREVCDFRTAVDHVG